MLIINWKDTLKRKQNKSEWNKVRNNTHAKKINRNAAAATWATQLNSNWILTVYSLKRIISEQPSHIMARDFHIRLSIHHPLRLWSEMHVCVCVCACRGACVKRSAHTPNRTLALCRESQTPVLIGVYEWTLPFCGVELWKIHTGISSSFGQNVARLLLHILR